MPDPSEFTDPDNFVAGTVGEPGDRVFHLDVTQGSARTTVSLEKVQVQMLAGALAKAMDELASEIELPDPVRPREMAEPVEAEWVVGELGLAHNPSEEKMIVQIRPVSEHPSGTVLRVHLDYGRARGFAEHALLLVEYGRNFGRQNGHRKP
ncbi:MAG TPA: DUF3090 family protein [Acidimicrobiales bacterium]|nr:DUF3090 family protein [Acidimicrobiales bacterium]